MLVLLCLIHPLVAPAQGLGRSDIFNTDNLPSGDGATTDLDAARARFIRINAPVLIAGDSPLHQPAPAELNLDSSRIELNDPPPFFPSKNVTSDACVRKSTVCTRKPTGA